MILDDADHPATENGVYVIPYNELVDGYLHAWRDERDIRKRVRYSRSADHPHDPRCPECYRRRRG